MPDQLEYIVKDALIMCDKGTTPGKFDPTFNRDTTIGGCLVATKADKIALVNIPVFGACACRSGNPCNPIPTEWQDTYKGKVEGQETLLYKSQLPCGSGGKITFITSGQVPLPPEEYDELLEEHGESEDGLSWWDGAEMVPFAGGVIGVVRSGAKGDWLGTGLSAASIVLDVGGLFSFGAGNGASAAVKGGKIARVGAKAAKAANKGSKAIRLTGKAAKNFASAAAKSVDNIALKTGKICVFACFTAGTPISVKGGHKNVEDIQVGDLVWAYNEETGESDLKPVVNTMQNEVDTTVKITLEDEVIESTVEHPFYTQSGWKAAADLSTEDEIKTKGGVWSYIKNVAFEYQKKKVYNFEVADWHTYFVGVLAFLVHNAAKCVSGAVKVISKRLKYLGRTPGKSSRTGREVFERMMNEKPPTARIKRGVKEFYDPDNKIWRNINQADMGHKTDAVTWWNKTGRAFEPKSKEVRDWMLDSDNYALEYYKTNRSKGAILGKTTQYLPPLK